MAPTTSTHGHARPSPCWGHWIIFALLLAGLAAALLVQRQVGGGGAPLGGAPLGGASPGSASPGTGTPAARQGPVLAPVRGRPGAVRGQPGTVSLTFDGGSGADVTARIVSALHRLRVPATFFIRGNRVAENKSVIRQELAAQDDVGMTGFTGADMAQMPAWRLNAELTETQYELLRAGARGTALVRPPGTTIVRTLTAATQAATRRLAGLGYVAVLADRTAQTSVSPPDVLRAVEPTGATAAGRPGLVLALSDTGRPGTAALAALPRLVSDLRSRGYHFTTIAGAFRLTSRPARVSVLSAAGADALLLAVRASGAVTRALYWAFVAAAALIAARLVLLVSTGSWHKLRDRRPPRPWQGPVSVIVPAYNERAGIERCLRSLLDCDYPQFEVILVDDGSTDGTAELVRALGLPVTTLSQANAGKAAALNSAVRHARHDMLVFADGDTVFEPETIARLVAPFCNPFVGAVAGNVKVANRRRLLGVIQHAEYVVGSSLDRRMYDVLNCMVTIPGAVGAFRRSAIADAGGVPDSTLAEDTDLTIAIGRAGWRVRYAAQARAWTEAPSTVRQLWNQRHRWNYGTMQALWKYRRIVVFPKGRRKLAWIGLPYLFTMACVLPLISPAADLYVLFNVWAAPWRALSLWAGFLAVQGTLTLCGFAFDGERLRYLWTVPFQQVFYRQLMYLVVLHSMATALAGVRLRWHKIARIGEGARQE